MFLNGYVLSAFVLMGFVVSDRPDGSTLLSAVDNTHSSSIHKRQLGEDLCYLPEGLKNGKYTAHARRCPAGDNSAACRVVPWTPVSVGWVLRYACDLGYQLNTTRIVSICLHQRGGGAGWLPPLPSCVESSYSSVILPPKNVCGKIAKNVRVKRKVDGKLSSRGAWPWMVVFGHNKTDNPRDGVHWFCAGTLVTSRHVLTAANCVASHRRRPVFMARLDDLNLDDSIRDGAQPIELPIDRKSIIVYPGFDPKVVMSHNIAVVRLKNDVSFTDYVRPVCLPSPDFMSRGFTGAEAFLTSWGQTDEDRDRNPKRKRRFEPILHEMNASIMDHDSCSFLYRGYQSTNIDIIISDKILCAAININRSCQGDTGSPLMIRHKDTYFMIGIVATDFRCFDEFYPRLFTKLSAYMEWIVANLKF